MGTRRCRHLLSIHDIHLVAAKVGPAPRGFRASAVGSSVPAGFGAASAPLAALRRSPRGAAWSTAGEAKRDSVPVHPRHSMRIFSILGGDQKPMAGPALLLRLVRCASDA